MSPARKSAATKPAAKKATVKAVAKRAAKAPAKPKGTHGGDRHPKFAGPHIPDWYVPKRPPRIYELACVQPDPTRDDLCVGEALPLMVLQGDRPAQAAQRLCVFHATLRGWVARGLAEVAAMEIADPPREEPADSETAYVWIAMGIMRAEAEWEHWAIQLWQAKFGADWHAVYAMLKSRMPNEWGDSSRVELTGANGGPIRTAVTIPTVAEARASLAAVEAGFMRDQRELAALDVAEVPPE